MKQIYAKLSELPDEIRKGLRSVNYNSKDIAVVPMTHVSPVESGGDGRRGFVVIVNLSNGDLSFQYGSWGGANIFNSSNAVDLDTNRYEIPPNFCVIKGTEGASMVHATIYVRPDMIASWLPSSVSLTAREQFIIDVLAQCNSMGRKREFNDFGRVAPSLEEYKQLEAKGLVKVTKSGAVSLTTDGKNARTPGFGSPKYAKP